MKYFRPTNFMTFYKTSPKLRPHKTRTIIGMEKADGDKILRV